MKNISKSIIVLFFTFFSLACWSQSSVGIYGAMNYGGLEPDSDMINLSPKWGGGVGVFYTRKSASRFELMAQVGLNRVEWQTNHLEAFNTQQDLFYRRLSLNFYAGGAYKMVRKDGFELDLVLLPNIGFVVDQDLRSEDVSVIISLYSNGLINTILFGLDSKVDFRILLDKNWKFHVRPGISTVAYSDREYYVQGLLNLDIGLSWSF